MSMCEMQACLARLYVDDLFRRLVYLDPAGTLEGYRLTPEESAALQGLNHEMLVLFAQSLKSKRKKRIERAFPLLFALDRAEVDRYFVRYYQLHPAKPHQSGHEDALAFGAFMAESLVHAERLPAFASDLARYEFLFYGASFATASSPVSKPPSGGDGAAIAEALGPFSRPGVCAGAELARFTHDVVAIEEAIQKGMRPEDIEIQPRNGFIVFRPAATGLEASMMRVNAPTKVVFELCDGRRTVTSIVEETESILRAEGLAERVLETIRRLLAARVLTLDPALTRALSVQQLAYGAAQAESL